MRTINHNVQHLATRVGAGDHAAFRHLYSMLAPVTLATVRVELPDPVHSMHVVRATFCEVWWMCAFDVRCGSYQGNVPKWIAGIAARRGRDRRRALELIINEMPSPDQRAFWVGLLADHDQWAHFELVAMLDGHDTVRLALPRADERLLAAS